jgi:replicative DNA helicase
MTVKTEALFISAVLRQEDSKSPVFAGVKSSWFTAHSDEWEWIGKYINRHAKTPSKALFKSKFPTFTILVSDDVEYCLDELREEHLRRQIVQLVDSAITKVTDDVPPLEIMSDLQSRFLHLQADTDGVSNESNVVSDWDMVYDEVSRRYERAEIHGQSGIPTGFATLDGATNGPQPGDYWIVAARLGQGKTWTLLRMACTAVYRGFTVQYDALEQSRAQITMRAHSFLSSDHAMKSFQSQDLINGKGFDLKKYKEFLEELKSNLTGKLIVNDTSRGRVTPATIAAQIERNKPDIVFIDYLTLMNSHSGDWQALGALSAEMKGIAMRYQVPIVAAAQINRTAIGEDLPGAEHLSGADAIGQDADCVVTMKQVSPRVIKMKLAKYRHGRDGQVWFNEFSPNSGKFSEISGDLAADLIDEDKLERGV